MQETLSIKECAQILRVSENAVRRGIKSGEWNIPHIMNGNRIVILRERFFREFLGAPVGATHGDMVGTTHGDMAGTTHSDITSTTRSEHEGVYV